MALPLTDLAIDIDVLHRQQAIQLWARLILELAERQANPVPLRDEPPTVLRCL